MTTLNRQCQECDGYELDNGVDEICDCEDVGMTPEAYLRDGKNEVDKALRELGEM